MREFQDRRRIRKFLHSRYAIAVLVLVCLFLGRAVWGVYAKYQKSEALEARVAAELAALEAREASLRAYTASLETEEGKEREIRGRFGVAKEGERVVVIVEDAREETVRPLAEERGLWSWIKGVFGGE